MFQSSFRPLALRFSQSASKLGAALVLAPLLLTSGVLVSGCGPSSSSREVGAPVNALFTGFKKDGDVELVIVDTNGDGVLDPGEPSVFLDRNDGGQAAQLMIEEVRWGRLVDIYDRTASGERRLQMTDYLVAESIGGDNDPVYELSSGVVDQREQVTINFDRQLNPDGFHAALIETTTNLGVVKPVGINGTEIPPFPLVPRNATLMVRFSDLLDASTIDAETIRLAVGTPPESPFKTRIAPDFNHGAFSSVGGSFKFFTTRVLIDPAVSEFESGPQTPVNTVGLPASTENLLVNIALRFPSLVDTGAGQTIRLTNVAGKGVATVGNGPIDNNATLDVVRAFRSGRSDNSPTNGDPNNGFMVDLIAPRILSQLPVTITDVTPLDALNPDAGDFLVAFSYESPACQLTPRMGHVIQVNGAFAEVTQLAAPPQNGNAAEVRMRVLGSTLDTAAYTQLVTIFRNASTGTFVAPFVPGPGVDPRCFIRLTPPPGVVPNRDIDSSAQFAVRFSEPMDPDSLGPHDNFRLNRVAGESPQRPRNIVVGQLSFSPDRQEFRYRPTVPLDNSVDAAETYYFNLVGGGVGASDLGGNPLENVFPADLEYFLDPTLNPVQSGGIVLRFNELSEQVEINGGPELRLNTGQVFLEADRGVIRPREVVRSSHALERIPSHIYGLAVPGNGTVLGGSNTPLIPNGSRMMTSWRYVDMGFSLFDESFHNIDVEGLSWATFPGTAPSTDFFERFEIALSHSVNVPDEGQNATFLVDDGTVVGGYCNPEVPIALGSGLVSNFISNVLTDPSNALKVVHPRNRGYLVDVTQVFQTPNETVMVPFPLNRGVSQQEKIYYTWRDTSILATGGTFSAGVPPFSSYLTMPPIETIDEGGNPGFGTDFAPGSIPSIALPLLMDFKCFPSDTAAGTNLLDVGEARWVHSPTTGGIGFLPVMRVFSSGGFNGTSPFFVNPDDETVGFGEFSTDPNLVDQNGNPIPPGTLLTPVDDRVYLGQADLVVRVSRTYSVWFNSKVLTGVDFADPVIEPLPEDQPAGTSVVLAFRGATAVNGTPVEIRDATFYDQYGDALDIELYTDMSDPPTGCDPTDNVLTTMIDANINPVFFNADNRWKSNINSVDGASHIQVRITFVSNVGTTPGRTPELSTLGLAFESL